jgi:hypothetical protein
MDYVPNDFPAITTSSFLQRYVSMNSTIAHVSATTATTNATITQVPATNATMTQVPATISATTNAPKYQLDKCNATQAQNKTRSPSILHPAKKVANYATPRCLLLLPVSNGTEITATNPSLLLLFYQNESAIMMATHANLLLLRVRDGPAIRMATHANFTLQLIVASIRRVLSAQNIFCDTCLFLVSERA